MARRNRKQLKGWDQLSEEIVFKDIKKDLADFKAAISDKKPKFRIVQSKMNNETEEK